MLKEQSRNTKPTSKLRKHITFSGSSLKWHTHLGWNNNEQDHLPDQQSKFIQKHEDIRSKRLPHKTENWLPQLLFFSHPNSEDVHTTKGSNSNLPLVTSEPRPKKPNSCSNRWNNISSCHRKDIPAHSKKSSIRHQISWIRITPSQLYARNILSNKRTDKGQVPSRTSADDHERTRISNWIQ